MKECSSVHVCELGWAQGSVGMRDHKMHKETYESDGYCIYLDCGDGFIGVYMCQNL